MPGTARADLDVITEDRLGPSTQPVELGGGPGAPAPGRKTGPEHVRDLHRPFVPANRAVVSQGSPHVPSSPQELGVGIAHVHGVDAAPADVPDDGVPHQAVLDPGLTGGLRGPPGGAGA